MYCAGCGERKRLTFPPHGEQHFCTQRCAAFAAEGQLDVGEGADFYCNDCGEFSMHSGCDGGEE